MCLSGSRKCIFTGMQTRDRPIAHLNRNRYWHSDVIKKMFGRWRVYLVKMNAHMHTRRCVWLVLAQKVSGVTTGGLLVRFPVLRRPRTRHLILTAPDKLADETWLTVISV